VRAIGSLQQIVFLLAAEEEHLPIGERFAMTERFRERYTLRCGVPRESSYAVPLSIGPVRALPIPSPTNPLVRALELFDFAALGAWDQVGALIPDPKYLTRTLAELQAMLPRPGDGWAIRLGMGGREVELGVKVYRSIRRHRAPDEAQDTVMTVTGELIRVDFAERHVVVKYRPTSRAIHCFCEPEVLNTILQNWQVPVQVTGQFTLDRRGHPTKLTGVTIVEPIDLSPMIFDAIEWGGRRLAFTPPLRLEPFMDEESGQFYKLFDEGLGIDVFAQTREQLADELAEQLIFTWDTYARENPEKLTGAARRLQEMLKRRMRESDFATRTEER
jgi:hypothetical protein